MKAALTHLRLALRFVILVGLANASFFVVSAAIAAHPVDEDASLLQADRAAFASGESSPALTGAILEKAFTWTDSEGKIRNKSQLLASIQSRNNVVAETGGITGHVHGQVGIIQENIGNVYVLRVWIKRASRWRLLIYHAVTTGAPPSAASDDERCENPCNAVPFHPQNADEADVIHAYQAVERAVTAHDSAAWGSHIAEEFFAVTSNSNRPLDKKTRMSGLDNQKVGGIAPFPLVSARMFEFGDVMIMTSQQQPLHGLPLHVTRVWFKRNNAWLEAYSYQTTIQAGVAPR